MRDILRKAKPQRLDDLIALNALYRPGPLKSGMVDDFIERKQGKREVKYELPQLEPILSDTYGVIAYQEQVMRIAQALAGFTLGQADVLRKAMGKKKTQGHGEAARGVRRRRRSQGHQREEGGQDLRADGALRRLRLQQVALDGLRVLAYQTAYLKANYPWHFAAALLTIEAQNTDKLAMYLGECRERGIPVLPPGHQREPAAVHGRAPGRGVRFGLDRDQGRRRGRHPTRSSRRARAPAAASRRCTRCARILDLRLVNKRVFEALVKAGACDSLVCGARRKPARPRAARPAVRRHRRRLRARQRVQRDKDLGQADLFGGGDGDGAPRESVTSARPTCRPGPRSSS